MQGQLFTQDFLLRGIFETPPYRALDADTFAAFKTTLQTIFQGIEADSSLNEAQTESQLIHPVLDALGWAGDTLPQVNLSAKGREDVPDLLLFANTTIKQEALALAQDAQRYRLGLTILEAKRWLRPLDRGDIAEATDPDAPSSQILRYLSRAEVVSDRAIQWGILTNGAVWRLYWQSARSRSEEFFEINLAAALHIKGFDNTQEELEGIEPDDALRLFYLIFQRNAFLPQDWDDAERNFHAYAVNEARLYETAVAQDLGECVFDEVFPQFAEALAQSDTGHTEHHFTATYLDEVREATLVLLYRLLFVFYAEDRNLLPVRNANYTPYSVRRLRESARDAIEKSTLLSHKLNSHWYKLNELFTLIDEGDDAIGIPSYNGGLFHSSRAPILRRAKLSDAILFPLIDKLSRRTEELEAEGDGLSSLLSTIKRSWINYRDLSVSHLGSIYERLLEYKLVQIEEGEQKGRIITVPLSFSRKVSGSYYTHNDLVYLVLDESIGLLAKERQTRFNDYVHSLRSRTSINPSHWEELEACDAASQILELKICDPAMGSGHFLVALVDYLADRILEAMTASALEVNRQGWMTYWIEKGQPWQSPLLQRVALIRKSIKTTAQKHGWVVTDAQLDDRHIIRRMILKKSIFGVDKNAMAVELAKTALWLHTFTVGAPLSFLDHHLKVGDSLHGEQLRPVQRGLQSLGALLLQSEFDRLALSAKALSQVADLTDADIAEAKLSQQLAAEADQQLAPLHAVLDFWRAMRWLIPGWGGSSHQTTSMSDMALPPALKTGLIALLNPDNHLAHVLAVGHLEGSDAATHAANDLIRQARAIAKRETFFHWHTSFPTVFGAGGRGGFDAVIGNPPWNRIKLKDVEWFAERDSTIAIQARAADRKRLIRTLEKNQSPLWLEYQEATLCAEANARVLGNSKLGCGDYPLLGGGDVNLYSLFVERALSLSATDGIIALVTPSGIAADKGAAPFFRSISSTGRLGALFDFENRKYFFPDVHASFKLCVIVFGAAQRTFSNTRCAFFMHSLKELRTTPERTLVLSTDDFCAVNPNTGAAPIFRTRRDADITLALYARHPVLVRHGNVSEALGKQAHISVWPVKYTNQFHMTNDSDLFLKADEIKGGKDSSAMLPLYEGKMVQMYDHRAADVVMNIANLKRPAQQKSISSIEKQNPKRYPIPQYWVTTTDVEKTWKGEWCIAYKSVTSPTNVRTMIAAIVPACGVGNSMAMLLPQPESTMPYATWASLLLANLNSMILDFSLRQKVQGQNLNWFIVEQIPVITPQQFETQLPQSFIKSIYTAKIGDTSKNANMPCTVSEFVTTQVLALTYTAHDMAGFARDCGYVDTQDNVLPPFVWDDNERHVRMAALDAVFFWLYGVNNDDAAYVMDSFPIVREQEEAAFGHYRTKEDVLQFITTLNIA